MNDVLRFAGVRKLLFAVLVAIPAGVQAGPVAHFDGTPDAAPAPALESSACTLASGAVNTFSFIWTPPEELKSLAWKLPTASCSACASQGGLKLKSVAFRVRWVKACSAQAEVSILGAVQTPICLQPDPSQVLCAPTTFTIASTGAGNVVHTLTLPAGCCVSGNAFLMVRFTGFGACSLPGVGPGLAASTSPCVNCEQFVTAANIFPTMTEWCSIGAQNSTWFSIEADCCGTTPVEQHSWSAIRTLYR